MDLLGVGPLEFIFVLLIIFLVLGPNDMAKTGKKIGRFLSTVRKSDFWRGVTQVTREMRDLPTTLMREAELEDVKQELEQDAKDLKGISEEFQHDRLKEIKDQMTASIDPRIDVEDVSIDVDLSGSPEQETEPSNQEDSNA
jgi:Sec-independent protein translocase protein TatA